MLFIIGVSVSKPHTSELNGGISLIYVYTYICIVRCTLYVQCTRTCAVYGHYAHYPRTRVNAFIDRFYSGFGAHGYSEYFQKSSETIARKTSCCAHENERQLDARQKQLMHTYILLCIVHIYIANM